MRFTRTLLVAALSCLCVVSCAAAGDNAPKRPNIILIVADDLGYGDVGVHGCKDIPTPHIDSLARNGVRCSNGYVTAPQCSPSRAGFLTGRYQQRFGLETNYQPARRDPVAGLPASEVTMADRLKAAGYASGMVGKWHLGDAPEFHPLKRGFGEFFGFTGGGSPYLPPGKSRSIPRILRGTEPAEVTDYLTDVFGREAVAFIERHRKEPFFLYLAFNAPHAPLEATDKYLKRVEQIADDERRTYGAMVCAMDDAIGAVLGKLRAAGLEEDTLLFFISDNGGPDNVVHSSNAPLRGVKGEVFEGGIRVPFLVQWKGKLPAGKVYDRPVISLDFVPTALAAAGAGPPRDAPLEGVNLLPHLTGKTGGPPHDVLYWRFNFPPRQPERYTWAIRQGDWKLLKPREEDLMLIDLADDMREANNVAARHPEKGRSLEAAWKRWNAELVAPVGGSAAGKASPGK